MDSSREMPMISAKSLTDLNHFIVLVWNNCFCFSSLVEMLRDGRVR